MAKRRSICGGIHHCICLSAHLQSMRQHGNTKKDEEASICSESTASNRLHTLQAHRRRQGPKAALFLKQSLKPTPIQAAQASIDTCAADTLSYDISGEPVQQRDRQAETVAVMSIAASIYPSSSNATTGALKQPCLPSSTDPFARLY